MVEPCKVKSREVVQLVTEEAAVRRTERSLVSVAGEVCMAFEVMVAKMRPEGQAGPSAPW